MATPAGSPVTFTQDTRALAIETPLGQNALLLRAFRGEEALSRLFRFDLELLASNPAVDMTKVVGRTATVRLALEGGKPRYFNGVISRMWQMPAASGMARFGAELVPWTWLLTRSTDCRVFQSLPVPDIVEKVCKDLGFQDVSKRLQKQYAPREYCVQYRETDFNFIARLLEDEGIFFYFEHENGRHTLVLGDSPAANPACPAYAPPPDQDASRQKDQPQAEPKAPVRYQRSRGAGAVQPEVVLGWSVGYEVRPGRYTLNAYNFEAPGTNLAVSVDTLQPTVATRPEVYDYPGAYMKRDEGEAVVRTRIEEEEARVVSIQGSSTCRGLAAGTRFDLTDHETADYNKGYVLTAVHHDVVETSHGSTSDTPTEDEQQDQKTRAKGYRNTFSCVPVTTTFRPRRVTPRPVVHGVQTAIVVGKKDEELWVDKYGRVKVQFHWDRLGKRDENSSCWIRVAQNWAGKRWGTIFLPRIGQEVVVEFLDGDPDQPLVTGRVYNGDHTPPYDLPADQTKTTIKSASSKGGGGFNEFRFEDKKGEEQVFLHAQRDTDTVVERASREWVGQDRHLIVTRDRLEQVDAESHLKVKGNQVEEVGGASSRTVAKDVYVKAGGRVFLEGAAEIVLRGAGGFIKIDGAGISIEGTVVNINCGGSATAATALTLKSPLKASSAGAVGQDEGTDTPDYTREQYDLAITYYQNLLNEHGSKLTPEERAQAEELLKAMQAAADRGDAVAFDEARGKLHALMEKAAGKELPPPPGFKEAGAVSGATDPTGAKKDASGTPTGPGAARLYSGALSVKGRRFVTPDGLVFRPVFCTGFRLVEQVARGQTAAAASFLDWAARTGFNGVRVLAMCNGMFKLSPAEGTAALPKLLAMAMERRLYVEVVALADTAATSVDLRAQVRDVGQICAASKNALLQIANEHYHATQSSQLHDASYLASLASSIPAGVVYTESPAQDDEATQPRGLYVTRHLDRSRDKWNMVRRVRELEMVSGNTGRPVINDEPIGAAEQDIGGKRYADPNVFFGLGVLNRLFEVGGTFHFESGLQAQLPGTVQQMCAQAFIQGSTLIPQTVDLTFKNATWADSPVADARFKDKGGTVVRVYSGVSGGKCWTVCVGKEGDPGIKWQQGFAPVSTVVDKGSIAVIEASAK